jgi:hypothetical protein
MEGNGTGATAMLVGTPTDVGGRPDAATVTMAREEIEEALASDAPLELILSVDRGTGTPQDVSVAWQRSDLETVLAGTDAGGITFSFDRAELYRALEHPDFEGHGIREMVLLTVAAASASAALAASTASGQLMEGTGGGGATAAVVVPGHGEATTARDLAAPTIHDEATATARGVGQVVPGADEAGLTARGLDPAIATAIGAHDEALTASTLAAPGIHDEATAAARGVGQVVPGADEAGLTARGLDPAIATAIGAHDEALTASTLAAPGIHDETTLAARGVDQIVPGADETTLAARGIDTPAVHDEGTLVTRGIEAPPVPADSSGGIEVPTLDSGTAAAIGGLAGAGLLIVGAAFMARRQRTTPA